MTTTRQPRRAARATPSTPPPPDRLQVSIAASWRSDDPAAAYAHFRPLAAAVPTDGLAVFTGNALVMKVNIDAALQALVPHVAVVFERMPSFELTPVLELPSLALALDHAAARVPAAPLSAGEIEALLTEARPLRMLTLAYLEVVSHPLLALVPAERVRAIREGTGSLDTARDCVTLPTMFGEFAAALEGKHPFSPEQLARLSELGNTLVASIRPKNAPAPAAQRSPAALLRDQFARLVEDRYDSLGVALTVAVGRRNADAMLPALRAFAPGASAVVTTPATPVTPQ